LDGERRANVNASGCSPFLIGCVLVATLPATILPLQLQVWLTEPGQRLFDAFKSFDTEQLAQNFEVRIRYCRYDWRLVCLVSPHAYEGCQELQKAEALTADMDWQREEADKLEKAALFLQLSSSGLFLTAYAILRKF
jgi:hypothetical protein